MLALLLVLLQLIVLIGLWRLLAQARLWREAEKEAQRGTGSMEGIKSIEVTEGIEDEARRTARQMLEEAYLKAQAIVGEGKDFRAQAIKSLSDKLEAAAREELTQFRAAMRAAEAESVNSIQNVSKSIESKVSQELLAFHETLRQQAITGQKQADLALKRELAMAADSVSVYKKQLLAELDEAIFAVVATVVKKVMREGLSEKEHETLVLQALGEAKQKHLL